MENINNQRAYNRAGEIMASDGCTFGAAMERVARKEPWLFAKMEYEPDWADYEAEKAEKVASEELG
jgi:hypothetical protein